MKVIVLFSGGFVLCPMSEDKELATKIALMHCKESVENSYTFSYDDEEINGYFLESRDKAQTFNTI